VDKKQVSGTIISKGSDGRSRFLLFEKENGNPFFSLTTLVDGKTAMGSLLNFFKDSLDVDLTELSLIELTNIKVNSIDLPFFVFELEDEETPMKLDDAPFTWEVGEKVQKLFTKFEIEGVPVF
jgi:hypothetical protein